MRLRVSSAATIPTGVFSQRFEALFSQARTLGCSVCLAPQLFLQIYPHTNVGPPSPPAAASPQVLSAHCPSLPLLPVWMNISSLTPWLLDFHTVQFSGSSGYFLFLILLIFWLFKETKCVYLCLHLGWKSCLVIFNFI